MHINDPQIGQTGAGGGLGGMIQVSCKSEKNRFSWSYIFC